MPAVDHDGLPDQDDVVTVPLTGDVVFQEGFNVNGISRTPDGAGLLVSQTNTGLLFVTKDNVDQFLTLAEWPG